MSYALYRWEDDISAAAILGEVGAKAREDADGPLGLFQMPRGATVMVAIIALVDAIGALLRRAS